MGMTVLALTGVMAVYAERTGTPPAQDAEKTLEIERYPNEPLELVELKIGEQAVKDRIRVGPKYKGQGMDFVKFRDKDGWFKSVKVSLRNVSGRPITGMRAYLFFTPPGSHPMFSLPLIRSKELKRSPLQSGEVIELSVSDRLLNMTLNALRQQGADANLSSVSFSVDSVLFGDDLQWSRGVLLRRDPDNPHRWKAVESKLWRGQPVGSALAVHDGLI
jgi:hypothetical protein